MPAKSTIGGTAVQLTATATPVAYGTLVRAAPGNTGTVYVGFSNAVTANSADATDGIPLAAGEVAVIPPKLASDAANIWLIGSASGQKVFWQTDLPELAPAGGTTTATISGSVTTASTGYTSQPTVTRPANQTPYTAGDVVGGTITFTNLGPSGGGEVMLTDANLQISITAVPSGMTNFRLHLYNVTPPSAIADNGAWTSSTAGDQSAYLGYVDLGTPAVNGSILYVQNGGVQKKVKLLSSSIWGYLVTNGGFTPAANSEVYLPQLGGVGV